MLISLDYRNETVLSSIEKLWRSVAPTWAWPRRDPYQAEYSWAFDQLMASVDGSLAGKKVMDAGGGGGAFQHVVAAAGADVLNVDVIPTLHKSKFAVPTKQHCAALDATELEEGSFDGIVSVSSIEHNEWSGILNIARHLLGLLKPGAALVLTFPAGEYEQWIPEGSWPLPHQAKWPKCYFFDEACARRLVAHVADLAELKTPARWFGEEYKAIWRDQHKDMITNSRPQARYPYLSAGLVFVRRTA
jgi:SAM-dependent methyltransferase